MNRILKEGNQKFQQIARSRGNETVRGERIVKNVFCSGEKILDRKFR